MDKLRDTHIIEWSKQEVDLADLLWDESGHYWYSEDRHEISPDDMLKFAQSLEQRIEELEEAGTNAFLSDDGLLWIGKAKDEHEYGMEFVGITLPKDRYFAFLETLAQQEEA